MYLCDLGLPDSRTTGANPVYYRLFQKTYLILPLTTLSYSTLQFAEQFNFHFLSGALEKVMYE